MLDWYTSHPTDATACASSQVLRRTAAWQLEIATCAIYAAAAIEAGGVKELASARGQMTARVPTV